MNMKSARPVWLDKKIDFRAMHDTEKRLRGLDLHTVCLQARCPNISECFSRGTATFLILGNICTRGCAFCGVSSGAPMPVDRDEPSRVKEAVRRMNIGHAVITSVTRDDLADGGAGMFAATIRELKDLDGPVTVEVLVPDFQGDEDAVLRVVEAGPDIFGHNIETVPSLYKIRSNCDYGRSLRVLEYAKCCSGTMHTKSAIMLGMGETEDEVISVMRDLRGIGCDFLGIGQYLRPGNNNIAVREYIFPERFEYYKEKAIDMGFLHVESGAYVRSSYMADRYGTHGMPTPPAPLPKGEGRMKR
jgi:lipoic acid synthetase